MARAIFTPSCPCIFKAYKTRGNNRQRLPIPSQPKNPKGQNLNHIAQIARSTNIHNLKKNNNNCMVFEPGHPVRALTIACPADVHGAPPSRPIMHALSTCAVPDPSLD